MLKLNKIHHGDWIDLMKQLDNESKDFCMTSPPYWGLRDYGVEGQLGLEPHPNEYIKKMIQGFSILKNKLKKTGSFYLNMGDTYYGSPSGLSTEKAEEWEQKGDGLYNRLHRRHTNDMTTGTTPKIHNLKSNWLQPKQLMLMPSRLAIAMQEDGWILRNDIIWHKPNPMPSSVKDRLNTSYEHLFHFVKSKKYYYDLNAIREQWRDERISDIRRAEENHPGYQGKYGLGYNEDNQKNLPGQGIKGQPVGNPELGKNPGDVLGSKYNGTEGHSNRAGMQREATIREKRIHQIIQPKIANYIRKYLIGKKNNLDKVFGHNKWTHWIRTDESGASLPSPEDWLQLKEILNFDDEFDELMTETEVYLDDGMMWKNKAKNPGDFFSITTQPFPQAHFAVYPVALCEKPIKSSCPEEGTVLDPFCGAGTTWVALKKYKPKAKFIGFELKKEYIDMAYLRVGKRLSSGPLLEYSQ